MTATAGSSGSASEVAGADDGGGEARTDETRRMRQALAEIRREGWKVAAVYGVVDAALVTLLANLVLSAARPSFVPAAVPVPSAVVEPLRAATGWTLTDPSVESSAVVGVAIGLVVFGVEVAVRVRRPLVEQFEAANPGLRESLRTARDAVERGRDSQIARRLYEDVVDELGRSSSVGLLDLRRLSATLLVLAVVSAATVPLAAVDLGFDGFGGAGDDGAPDAGREEYAGLQDPSAILGDPEDVPTGDENLDALVDTSGSGSGDETGPDSAAAYDDSGFAGSGSIESQQAGFTEGERIEDAALIREYNLRIREGTDG